MTRQRIHRVHRQGGYTFVDLLTSVAIFAVIAAAGLPHLEGRRQDIQTATRQVLADHRWARARSITSGAHYAVVWTSDISYEVQRFKQVGTTWQKDETVKTVELPADVIRYGWPDTVEFNTRGMMISTETKHQQFLWDNRFETQRVIDVWPSGQTLEYVY